MIIKERINHRRALKNGNKLILEIRSCEELFTMVWLKLSEEPILLIFLFTKKFEIKLFLWSLQNQIQCRPRRLEFHGQQLWLHNIQD